MNNISLMHNNVKNQQSSWIDDPFQLGNNFKGLRLVNHKTNLSNYAEELAYTYGKYNGEQYDLILSELPEDEQNELVRLYLESIDRETSECVHGKDFSIDNDYTCALLAMLKDDCEETREHFATITRKNIIIYYTDSLQYVLDEGCHDLLCNMNNESGMYSRQDIETGAYYWSKY